MKSKNPIRKMHWVLAPILGLAVFPGIIFLSVYLINATNARLLDGLFGIYTNTPFQNFALKAGLIAMLLSPVLGLAFGVYFAIIRKDLRLYQRVLSLIFSGLIILYVVLASYISFVGL